MKVHTEKITLETDQGIIDSEERRWRLSLREVYKHGLAFYKGKEFLQIVSTLQEDIYMQPSYPLTKKSLYYGYLTTDTIIHTFRAVVAYLKKLDKEGKAIHLSYEDRLKLVAYTQQASHGPLDVNSAAPLGVLDVIGRDRRAAWQSLGQMSQIQAMAGFVHTLDRLCLLFRPYIEAIQKDLEDKKQQELKKEQEEKSHVELENRIILEEQKQTRVKLTEEQQVQRIKDALNAQSYEQFLQYAQQQFPGNFDQQAVLIRQLQDQHYQQYIQQLAVDQRLANSNINSKEENKETLEVVIDCNSNDTENVVDHKSMQTADKDEISDDNEESREDEGESEIEDGLPSVEDARMWTRSEVDEFKQSARAHGGMLTVGQGETVTVRVPTHHRARSICWEFATDHYDIGFGVYFEWSKSPTTDVTVHVSESDDEEEDDDYSDEEYTVRGADPEIVIDKGELTRSRPMVSLIVPIYRRDCHTEVYAGSHTYPGDGIYLLKFDNTYSLWRSKSLYYKVYYIQ